MKLTKQGEYIVCYKLAQIVKKILKSKSKKIYIKDLQIEGTGTEENVDFEMKFKAKLVKE